MIKQGVKAIVYKSRGELFFLKGDLISKQFLNEGANALSWALKAKEKVLRRVIWHLCLEIIRLSSFQRNHLISWSYSKCVYRSSFLCKPVLPGSHPIKIYCKMITNMQTDYNMYIFTRNYGLGEIENLEDFSGKWQGYEN